MVNGKIKVWLPAIRVGSGADVYTQRLAKALEHYGLVAEITWFPLRFEPVPFLLKNTPPPPGTDIVVANSWNGFVFKRVGLPLVVTEHHCVFDPAFRPYKSTAQDLYHRFVIKPFEMHSFRVANAITAVSDFTADSLRRNAGLMNVEVIYNWVDTVSFCLPTENRRTGGPYRLLFVGNPSRRKGVDLLAPIMRKLGSGFELHFTTGLKAEEIAGCRANMVPLGKLTDEKLIRAYQECDALLFPSRFEGFGYAALEAMACGKPVIATNATGLREVVQNGETGILCPPDDVCAFVNACKYLAAQPDICKQYGLAARQRVVEKFSESVILPQYIELYTKLLDNCGTARNPI